MTPAELKTARKRYGTQTDVCHRLGISPRTWEKYEQGRSLIPPWLPHALATLGEPPPTSWRVGTIARPSHGLEGQLTISTETYRDAMSAGTAVGRLGLQPIFDNEHRIAWGVY